MRQWYVAALFTFAICISGFAEPPPSLPGDEITGQLPTHIRADSTLPQTPAASQYSPDWYTEAVKSWDAPPMSQQIDEDETQIPMGKGAIFVPRLSDPALEPDMQITDSSGEIVASGKAGHKYLLVPGTYSVVVGSGAVQQRTTKWVTVDEGKITPVYPTWSGLVIEIVNETNIPFRGSYEMARIDEFEPFGRTYGRDPSIGEQSKTWILKSGTYKIFGVGESYSAVNSYVTVRLLPGELIHFTIVQDQTTQKIVSGGVSSADAISQKITSNWRYGLDLGGSILFNTSNDTNNSAVVLLSNLRVNYTKGKNRWDTKFFLDQELNFSDLNISQLKFTSDDFRIYSLYVWRYLTWFGPYGSLDFQTHFFPVYSRFDQSSTRHLFVKTKSDSSVAGIDSSSSSQQTQPSLSPLSLNLSVGANIDALTSEHIDCKFRAGLGYQLYSTWDQYQDVTNDTAGIKPKSLNYPNSIVDTVQLKSLLQGFSGNYKIMQQQENNMLISYGPEFAIDVTLRIGKFINTEGEVITLLPVEPLIEHKPFYPNYQVNTVVSWRLTRSITIDYLYQYQLQNNDNIKIELSQHRVWLRYSFNSSR